MDLIVLFSLFLFLFFILPKKSSNSGAFVTLFIMILISGLRGINEGVDLPNYLYGFNNPDDVDYNVLFEPGYRLFFKYVHIIFNQDYQYIVISSLLVIIPLYFFLKKESKNVFLSLFLWITLSFYTESFNIIRQSISISFLLCAFYFIERGKLKLFVLFSLIAISFHYSSIFSIPIYFICKKINIKHSYTLVIISITILIGLMGVLKLDKINLDISNVFKLIGNYGEKSQSYFGDTNMYDRKILGFIFIYIPSSIFTIIVSYYDKNRTVYLKMLIIATAAQNLLYYIAAIDRVVLFLLVLQIVVFVNIYEENRVKLNGAMKLFVLYYLLLFIYRYTTLNLSGVYPYEFIQF